MCEAPIDEELINENQWNRTARIGDDEGIISKPNFKAAAYGSKADSKFHSLESYNCQTRKSMDDFGSIKSKTRLESSINGPYNNLQDKFQNFIHDFHK